jgi:hypothetical protein
MKKEPWRGGPSSVTHWDAGSYAAAPPPRRHPATGVPGELVSAIFTGETNFSWQKASLVRNQGNFGQRPCEKSVMLILSKSVPILASGGEKFVGVSARAEEAAGDFFGLRQSSN